MGLDAYTAAGGTVQRDLFSEDRGGWITDATLLERLVAEHMELAVEAVRTEGWKWVAIGPDAQAGTWNLRRVWPSKVALSPEDEQRRDELASRYDELAEEHNRSADDLPENVAAELDRIDAELAAIGEKQDVFRPEDVARAGAVVTLAADGSLRIERGYVRPEDEAQLEPVTPDASDTEADGAGERDDNAGETPIGGSTVMPFRPTPEPDEDKAPALSAALLAELQAHRTAGLQAAIAGQPELALRVMLHGLATDAFYGRYGETVAGFHSYPPALASACPGIANSPVRQAMAAAEDGWRTCLPPQHRALWEWLQNQGMAALLGLLAVCVARTANAGSRTWTTPEGSRCIAALVAGAARLDMRQCWTTTKESYLGRVPKALILDAVCQGAGASVAGRIAASKKEVMVADVAQLLDGKGWLPTVLRVPGATYPAESGDAQATPALMAAE